MWKQTGFKSEDIAKNPSAFYGQIVENYNVKYNTSGNNYWRIFLADDSNVYLLSDGFMHYTYGPQKNGIALTTHFGSPNYKETPCILSFDDVYSQYTGASDIDRTIGNKWLSKYLNKYPNSTYINIRSVAYMLDTSIWNEHYKNDYAEYAIGGPTVEMYCQSYKDTHPNKYLECIVSDKDGYSVKWSTDSYYSSNVDRNFKN